MRGIPSRRTDWRSRSERAGSTFADHGMRWDNSGKNGHYAPIILVEPVAAENGTGRETMPDQNWTMRGEYMESCNCDYLCPCIYTNPQGPATHDHCIAVMVFGSTTAIAAPPRSPGSNSRW